MASILSRPQCVNAKELHLVIPLNLLLFKIIVWNILVILHFFIVVQRTHCEPPTEVANGNWVINQIISGYGRYGIGSEITYECSDDYYAFGETHLRCQSTGYWSDNAPKCLPKGEDIVGLDVVLTHCGVGDFNEILDEYFSSQLQWLMAEIPAVKLPSEECH